MGAHGIEHRSLRGTIVLLALLLGGSGCSSNGAAEPQGASAAATSRNGGGDAATITCANDPRAEAYAPGIAQPGNGGAMTFTLVSASPAPPALGDGNMWTLKLSDRSGASISDATFGPIRTWMPDHGHGSTPGIAVSNGDGTYSISNLYFFMPGLWQITFSAQRANDAPPSSDSATFSFCVGG